MNDELPSKNAIPTKNVHERWSHLIELLERIYGEEVAQNYKTQFIELIASSAIQPRAYPVNQATSVLIAYGDHLHKSGEAPLKTLHKLCTQYLKGTVDTIHILPHYPVTENGFTDGGFAVSDYLAVNPVLGTWNDMHDMQTDFHLMFDDVLNHSSVSHQWFKRFLAGDPRYAEYYLTFDKPVDVTSITRPRTHPLLTKFETTAGPKYVWTTFSTAQADLNYANPEVLLEATNILLEYIRHGADLVRMDAVGFVWKELGTTSLHHPKAYDLVQFMREVILQAAPWVLLVTETNVPHAENISYFGDGHNQAQMIYNFTLPPLLVHTIHTGDASKLTNWAATLEVPSDETTFFNFTASHDGIGVRGVTGILSDEEMEAMFRRIETRGGLLSYKTNPNGTESVYEMNCSYFNAVSDPEVTQDIAVSQFMCSQAIALSLKGIPGIYMHSILGSTNWSEGVSISNHNRDINRQKLDVREVEKELGREGTLRQQIFGQYTKLLDIRKNEPAFSPLANQEILESDARVFAVLRTSTSTESTVLALHNVSNEAVRVSAVGAWKDLISGQEYTDEVVLAPCQVCWLTPQ